MAMPIKSKDESLSIAENQKDIENRKKTADHLLAAKINQYKAISHLEEGNYKIAAEYAKLAENHLSLAGETKKTIE